MIPITIAALMWLVVVSAAVTRRRGSDRTILAAASLVAVALTLNIDPVYLGFDRLLGGSNHAELVADLALMVGITSLTEGLAHSTAYRPTARTQRIVRRVVAFGACVIVIVLFFAIHDPRSSTRFMIDYGAQPAAAAYSMVQFSYIGFVMGHMSAVCWRSLGDVPGRIAKTSYLVLGVGGLTTVILCGNILAMDLTHVLGREAALAVFSDFYDPLYLAAMIMLGLGYSIPVLLRLTRHLREVARSRALLRRVLPIWKSVLSRGSVPAGTGFIPAGVAHSSAAALYRLIVEIRDVQLRDHLTLGPDDERFLTRAEDYLLTTHLTITATAQ